MSVCSTSRRLTRWSPARQNLAVARLRLEQTEAALSAAQQAVALEPRFAKGWLRQGEAQAALGKAADAIASFEAGLLRAEGAARLALTRALQRAREVQAKAAQEASRRAAAARQQPSEASAASAAAGALEPSPPSPRRGGLTRRAP